MWNIPAGFAGVVLGCLGHRLKALSLNIDLVDETLGGKGFVVLSSHLLIIHTFSRPLHNFIGKKDDCCIYSLPGALWHLWDAAYLQ